MVVRIPCGHLGGGSWPCPCLALAFMPQFVAPWPCLAVRPQASTLTISILATHMWSGQPPPLFLSPPSHPHIGHCRPASPSSACSSHCPTQGLAHTQCTSQPLIPKASLSHLRRPITVITAAYDNGVLKLSSLQGTEGSTSQGVASLTCPEKGTSCPPPPSSACQGQPPCTPYGQQGQSMSSSSHCKSAGSIIMLCHTHGEASLHLAH